MQSLQLTIFELKKQITSLSFLIITVIFIVFSIMQMGEIFHYPVNSNQDITALNKKLDKIDVMIKTNLSKLEIFSNAIYKVMYEVNTSSEYKIYESDGNKKIIDKKLRYNRELYNKLSDIFMQNNYMIKETIDELNLRRN